MVATGRTSGLIPYGRQTIDDDDIAAVAEALRGDFLTTGPLVGRYEEAFAGKVGARFAVSCTSGTAALHLAMLAGGVGQGDLVIVPSVTFLATANAARYVGAEVVFADVDSRSGLLTSETFQDALTRATREKGRPRAVLPVHLKGVPADMPAIAAIAERGGLLVVEDAAHAAGTLYGEDLIPVGANRHSGMAVFSTHPVKTLTTAEGGIVTTSDQGLAKALRRFRSHGMVAEPADWLQPEMGFENGEPAPWYYEMAEIGYNYRLPDINCALGLAQLHKLDRFVARRAELVALYDGLFAPLAPLLRIPERPGNSRPAWHLYAVQIDFDAAGLSRSQLIRRLRDDNIGTQVHYIPVHRQPYYRQRYATPELPGADAYYRGTLSLPLYPAMRNTDAERVAERLTFHLTHP
jgi:UDP-4-amino-4,6-dideoxy-N-acetyl-beta-L-altrosamine transaminase